MTRPILGLDVGGANLKAATPDGRAVGVPFALWKQPDRLPAALADLAARFPDAAELAVTMTGELCDCYETKRQGVNAILDAVEHAAAGRPVRVWGTGGEFLTASASRTEYMRVAAANWHALATFAGRYAPKGLAILIDIGSTTTDVIPLRDGRPATNGLTDPDRMAAGELVYTGVRRTPICAVLGERVAAELFATTLDAYVFGGSLPEDATDCDTADGRPATKPYSHARLCRMLGGDVEVTSLEAVRELAAAVYSKQVGMVSRAISTNIRRHGEPWNYIVSGIGEFLTIDAIPQTGTPVYGFDSRLPPEVSARAPAYAVAVLAAERPL